MLRKIVFAAAALTIALPVYSYQPAPRIPALGKTTSISLDTKSLVNDDYRIGSEWGKQVVTAELIANNPGLAHIAKATGRVGGGTGFYMGKFDNQHLMATNHHVCPRVSACQNIEIRFPLLGAKAKVKLVLGTWPEVDLSLFTVEFVNETAELSATLAEIASPFVFDATIFPGQELITAGFGVADNAARNLVANLDSDCKVFSDENEFRLMADPDEFNPGPYKAWSFSNGCDVSHGDSGSAMVERSSGKVVGIIWTGKIPKNTRVQDTAYLDELMANRGPDIWTELSFAVPAPKIGEFLRALAANTQTDATVRSILVDLTN